MTFSLRNYIVFMEKRERESKLDGFTYLLSTPVLVVQIVQGREHSVASFGLLLNTLILVDGISTSPKLRLVP